MLHLVFDWDGTIAKKEVAEEASLRRNRILGIEKTPEWMREAQKTHAHYDVNRAAIEHNTGITDKRAQTIVMTNIFHYCYTTVAHEWGARIYFPEMLDTLNRIKTDFKARLSIATTLRQDIIDHVLAAQKITLFDHVYGNTPALDHTKTQLVAMALKDCGHVHLMTGDREDDLQAGRNNNAKTFFAAWGHGELKNKKLADHIGQKPKEIYDAVKRLAAEHHD